MWKLLNHIQILHVWASSPVWELQWGAVFAAYCEIVLKKKKKSKEKPKSQLRILFTNMFNAVLIVSWWFLIIRTDPNP